MFDMQDFCNFFALRQQHTVLVRDAPQNNDENHVHNDRRDQRAEADDGIRIRFCMSDPRQKRAVEELNAQGRLKAQFLTNAILHYVGIENGSGGPSRAELEAIVRSILENTPRSSQTAGAPAESKVCANAAPNTFLTEENLNTIAGTLKAFRK